MAFSEFYCDASAGANINSGSTTSGTAAYSATNGGWNSGTGVFTPASGNPSLSVNVGDFASIYTDGATLTGFVGRVTAVSSTTITVSITAKSGTIPTTGASGISCKVGGCWKGPNGAEAFPFGFIVGTQTNSSADCPRVNFKSGTNYAITAAMTHSVAGPVAFQGYTTTPGDFGRATIDGGTSGASYILLTLSGGAALFADFIVQNNGATGSALGVFVSTSGANVVTRCVITAMRGIGITVAGGNGIASIFSDSEVYGCNQSNVQNQAVQLQSSVVVIRVISHDNAGSLTAGFAVTFGAILINCISESNGFAGLTFSAGTATELTCIGCDFYNNGSDGIRVTATTLCAVNLQNCNFVKNAGWGYNRSGSTIPVGMIQNCGFGTGTQANTSGTTTGLGAVVESGSVTYASGVTPWVDPANGDFRINLAAAKGAGRGAFTQTASSYAGTVGYPDIGAAQHLETAGGVSRGRML